MNTRRVCKRCRLWIEADESYTDHALEWHPESLKRMKNKRTTGGLYNDVDEPDNEWWTPDGASVKPRTPLDRRDFVHPDEESARFRLRESWRTYRRGSGIQFKLVSEPQPPHRRSYVCLKCEQVLTEVSWQPFETPLPTTCHACVGSRYRYTPRSA